MKKSFWGVLICLLVMSAFPLTTQAGSPMMANWRVEYYNNPSLAGHPVQAIIESSIDRNWGHGSPNLEVQHDYFSSRWTATVTLEKGTYLFILTVDDGARLWLDGRLILDEWNVGPQRQREARVRIEETGEYELQLAHFEYTGKAVLKLETLQLGGEDDIVGAWHGEYFNNKELAGTPDVVRQDGGIFFDWNYSAPLAKVAQDNFSVRWTRSIYLKRPGAYIFRIQHDDGMRIYVDGKIIYDSWFDQAVTYQVRKVLLKPGYRTFTVEYYEHIGQAVAQLTIEPDPGDYSDKEDNVGETGVVVKSGDVNFNWYGPQINKLYEVGGFNDKYIYTLNSGSSPINYGRWRAPIGVEGNYEVYAYIPTEHADATSARYVINHFGRSEERVINQSAYSGEFVSLGRYFFDGGGDEYITLYDNTNEYPGTTELAFDAIKFVRR